MGRYINDTKIPIVQGKKGFDDPILKLFSSHYIVLFLWLFSVPGLLQQEIINELVAIRYNV